MHIDKQILGTRIHEEIAQKELDTQQRQFDNAEEMERLIQDKFSSEALYTWMLQEQMRLYEQVFGMTLDVARKAQRTLRYELGRDDLRFIGGDYWQDGRAGLLAGERLHHDLKRMDVAYLDENRRELELTKHVSLRDRFPEEFFDLIETGVCEIELDEGLFDMDYPGQYMRRLKSVSMSIPCVAGPYTNVNCTLSLQSHRTRRNPTPGGVYVENPGEDRRFSYGFGPIQSIATSTGQNDAGVFEVNFRDERYLPFEGAGAISRWSLELPADQNRFDVNTVSDIVLHIKYTARDAGGQLRQAASRHQQGTIQARAGTLALDVRHEFPDAWFAAQQSTGPLSLVLTAQHFPFLPNSGGRVTLLVDDVRIRGSDAPEVRMTPNGAPITTDTPLGASPPDAASIVIVIPRDAMAATDRLILLVDYARPQRSSLPERN